MKPLRLKTRVSCEPRSWTAAGTPTDQYPSAMAQREDT